MGPRVPSVEDSETMRSVNAELGLDEAIRTRTTRLMPAVQVVFPDHRLELGDLSKLPKELERELSVKPQSVQNTTQRIQEAEREVGGFLMRAKEMPARGFFFLRKVTGSARTTGLSTTVEDAGLLADAPPALSELLVSALPFLTHLDARLPEDATVGRFARPVMRFLRGFRRPTNGRGIRSLVFEGSGPGAFDLGRSTIERLEPLAHSVRVRIRGVEALITADAILDASGDLAALATIPGAHRRKELAFALQAARPVGFLHVLSVEVDRRVIPPVMSTQVLLLNGRRDPARIDAGDPDAADRPIWITRRPGAFESREHLIISQPVSVRRARAAGLGDLEEIMQRRTERLIPFLRQGDPQRRTFSVGSQDRPTLIHPLYDPEVDATTGLGGLTTRTSFKNVFIAGPSVLPGLGIEGAYRSAQQAAEAICRALRG